MTKTRIFLLLIGLAGYSLMLYSPTLRKPALQGFYLVIPVFAALVLFPRESSSRDAIKQTRTSLESRPGFERHYRPVVALFLALQLISLAVIRLDEVRNTAYYTLMFASLLLVCWQVVRVTRTSQPMSFVILVEIGLLLSNVVSSKVFSYYYYFGCGDSIVHSHFVDLISATGGLQPEMWSYEFFPLTHVIATIVREISGIGLSLDSLHWPFVTAAFASPFAVYKIAQRIGLKQPIPMYSALIVPTGSLGIWFYSEAMPQGLVFFLALVLIMCALAPRRLFVSGIPILLLIVSTTLTHQVTIPFAIAGVIVAGFFAARLNNRRSRDFSMQTGVFFTLIYLSYFAFVTFALFYQVVLHRITFTSEGQSLLDTYNSLGSPTSSYLLISVIRNSGISLTILFIAMAIGTILTNQGEGHSRRRLILLAFLAVVSIVYFPGPLSFSRTASEGFALWRISHFAEPVVLVATAVGISLFVNEKSRRRMIGIAAIMIIIIFTAIFSGRNDMDNPWIGGDSYQTKTYFLESDARVMDFARLNANGLTVCSDFPVLTYLFYEGVDVSSLTAKNKTSVIQGDRFVLFRFAEFESPGCLVTVEDYQEGFSDPFQVRVADATPLYTGSQIIFDDGRNLCAITVNPIVLSVSR